jgi:hypothetical protein
MSLPDPKETPWTAVRVATTVETDGELNLTDLPYRRGDKIQIVVNLSVFHDAGVATLRRTPTTRPFWTRNGVDDWYSRAQCSPCQKYSQTSPFSVCSMASGSPKKVRKSEPVNTSVWHRNARAISIS